MIMNRVVGRRICVNVYGLRVPQRNFCSDVAAKVSGTDAGQCGNECEPKQSFTNDGNEYDVAIVGGGMVGMALACSLASMPLTKHLNVAIIDSNPALGKKISIKKDDPPDPRVSTVTPSSISYFKDIGAWKYVEQNRHAYFDKMQVWDYTGLGYTRYNARDVNKDFLGCVVENKVLHSSLLSCMQSAVIVKMSPISLIYQKKVFTLYTWSKNLNSEFGTLFGGLSAVSLSFFTVFYS